MERDRKLVYIKACPYCRVNKKTIRMKDILKLECGDMNAVEKIKEIPIQLKCTKNKDKDVISILDIITLIHEADPQIIVINEGEKDVVLEYQEIKKEKKTFFGFKTFGIVMITFLGSAFSIMSFNNDISVNVLFSQIYYLMTGVQPGGITVIDIFYSIGIAVGILVFFDHFGKKRFSDDPTPTEIELRKHQEDSRSVIIDNLEKRGKVR